MTQPRVARTIAYATLVLVATVLAAVLYLGPQIVSSKDTADLSACRAELSALLGDARDLRAEAVFDALDALASDDRGAFERIHDQAPAIRTEIAQAAAAYRKAVRESRTDPEAFLARCRR